MKTRALALSVLLSLATTPALAQTPPPAGSAWPGTLRINVDARDLDRRIFKVTATVPAKPGPLTLLYPQWLPGNHSPSGPIDKLAGLQVTANGKPLKWERDQFNVYAFKVDVPQGATEVVARFNYLSSQGGSQGRVVMTPEMLNLQWNASSLYPSGVDAGGLQAQASVTLPAGWSYATALETERRDGDTVVFKPISYEHLVDSPLFAGEHFQRFDLDPGAKQPVHLNVFADDAKSLKASSDQLKAHRALVQQMDKLYGARHFDHYDFLLALTDKLGGIGLEHHRSSENSGDVGYFTEWDKTWLGRDLLPHEFNHSWNGKYRRGADLATANFNVPMGDSLLWVYEGQTQFWGQVLAARSGLWSQQQARDMLANVAATFDRGRPGLAWRPLQDTTNDPTIAQRRGLAYRNYQMSEDYYSGGQMLWLEVEGKLRALSGGKRGLDDFAKAFFGMDNGTWDVNPYTFDDVVATLNNVAPADWAGFLRERLDGHGSLIGGLEMAGWKLVYRDTPNDAFKAQETRAKAALLTYSIGATVNDAGVVGDVVWDSPAFNAGLAPGMTVIAVDGREYKSERLKEVVAGSRESKAPITLLVKNFDRVMPISIDYHGGALYPALERIAGTRDGLSALWKAR
ncbi:glycyl aminopeptidase [Stenotrophomonas maltophilia]|uniref:M61 family metallopeptidase n=1 Tax=Stenotrophomonas chelatiphaga TaxID=517011 RepID=UPI000F4CC549|nr:tetratricopeptide repeat protein [Stenotrophomonas chelatiphaga]MCS4229832.1 putative metalloprotease with PDZ domain [Stenotrophomonas chelatiphaga]ROQ38019.1 glycyl aminopeptidase [Stenotrophomonas maltophilia]